MKIEVRERKGITGLVFNMQKFSLHDGPGIRTLVFMKGCPLACKWCDNPEGQKPYPQLRFVKIKCVGANKCDAPCVGACPEEAITISQDDTVQVDRRLCTNCGKCAEVCLFGALTVLGERKTIDEVLAQVERDHLFYDRSGGGVTIGGGEPLMKFEFVLQFLRRCKERFLDTALETCGQVQWKCLKKVSRYLDLIYYDIKHIDPVRHEELTGVSNKLILSNARKILSGEANTKVVIRTEVIPGYNDSEENVVGIARFIAESGGKMIELLPYHALGSSKYRELGIEYELTDTKSPTEDQMGKLRNIIKSFGLQDMTGAF